MFVLWTVCQEKTHSGGGGLNSGIPAAHHLRLLLPRCNVARPQIMQLRFQRELSL